MKPHFHANLIRAWADGAIIQYFDTTSWIWIDVKTPSWDEKTEYRIKLNAVKMWKALVLRSGHRYHETSAYFYRSEQEAKDSIGLSFVQLLPYTEIEVDDPTFDCCVVS